MPYYEFLYYSTLADGLSPGVIAQILARARPHNAANDITGLLVFDGQRFCHHLEGAREPLEALMARIAYDPRHTDVRIVHEGPLTARRYARFDMGYAPAEEPQRIDELFTLRDTAAVARFLAMRPGFDLQGG